MSDLPDHVTRARNLEVHEAQDGLVVFDPATDRVHHLNPTAAVLFELCAEPRATAELAGLVADLYDLDAPPSDEVAAGLQQLLAEKVLLEAASRGDS